MLLLKGSGLHFLCSDLSYTLLYTQRLRLLKQPYSQFAFWTMPYHPNKFLACSGLPKWKQLISHPPDAHRCIFLIMDIFSDKDEIRVVQNLSGADAQAFINTIDKVPSTSTHLEGQVC